MSKVQVSIVVAFSNEHTIGHDGGMPWHLREDLKRFKRLTLGKPVIMGRKTFESLGKPLPGRTNIVITRQHAAAFADGVLVYDTLEAAIDAAKAVAVEQEQSEVCVIGGGQIYEQAIEFADIIHATHIIANIDGDTKFPDISMDKFAVVESQAGPMPDEFNSHPTIYLTYERK